MKRIIKVFSSHQKLMGKFKDDALRLKDVGATVYPTECKIEIADLEYKYILPDVYKVQGRRIDKVIYHCIEKHISNEFKELVHRRIALDAKG